MVFIDIPTYHNTALPSTFSDSQQSLQQTSDDRLDPPRTGLTVVQPAPTPMSFYKQTISPNPTTVQDFIDIPTCDDNVLSSTPRAATPIPDLDYKDWLILSEEKPTIPLEDEWVVLQEKPSSAHKNRIKVC